MEVLIIDDDLDIREMLAIVLRDHGYAARVAASVEDAEAALRDGVPDVVLTDLNLGPGQNGCALAERLRADPSTRHVGRVAMTARHDVPRTLAAVFHAFLRKPFDTAIMLELIARVAPIGRARTNRSGAR